MIFFMQKKNEYQNQVANSCISTYIRQPELEKLRRTDGNSRYSILFHIVHYKNMLILPQTPFTQKTR